MSKKTQKVIGCIPVELGKRFMPEFPGNVSYSTYKQVPCPECGESMWLGEESENKAATEGIRLACMSCVMKSTKLGEALSIQVLT